MRRRQFMIAVALATAASTGGSACAMTKATAPAVECTLSGPDQLVAALGGTRSLCGLFNQAAASSGVRATVHVQLLNAHAAVAHAAVGGRMLAERRIDISDRPLNRRSIETLAAAIADQLREFGGSGSTE